MGGIRGRTDVRLDSVYSACRVMQSNRVFDKKLTDLIRSFKAE